MYSIQVVSDLHLETDVSYNMYELPKTAGVRHLALLGDIGEVAHPGLWVFIEASLRQYETVFFLFGNHEPWGRLYEDSLDRVGKFVTRVNHLRATSTTPIGYFVFMNQTRYDVPGTEITVLGCTLFSRVIEKEQLCVAQQVNDFNRIVDWMIADHNEAHRSDLRWLNEEVLKLSTNEPTRQIIIFTHYCPTIDTQATNPRHSSSQVSSAFRTDLSLEECWTSPNVRVWAFGHTHYNCDYIEPITGKRVVANQRGYAKFPRADFSPEKAIRLG